ncbi:MAG: helix-turn-helix domain-containing protein [Methylocystis sp.]|nr:helix-turn-helix domain-containing protein [Methylocystis sp.]
MANTCDYRGQPCMISAQEAAQRLGICERQLRALVRDGKLPFVNVGVGKRPAYRFRPIDIEAFILHRHTAATRLTRETGNLKLTQKMLRHKRITTTARYAHATEDDLREAMNKAAPVATAIELSEEQAKGKVNEK